MVQARDILRERIPSLVPVTELLAAPERARRGDRDAAIAVMRQAVDDLHQAGRLGYGVLGTGFVVETLLERGAEGDLAEAQDAIDRLANLWQATVRRCARSRYCGCGLYWRGHVVTRLVIATIGIVTGVWRHRLASKDTSRWPRR